MYERLEECPICKHTQAINKIICEDHLVSGESFAIVQCTNCELLFTNPRPDVASLPNYYKSDQYVSHTNKSNSLINIIYRIARVFTLRSKYKLITKYQSSGSILDYGCGTGDFLYKFKTKGWRTIGLEPDDDARQIAENKPLDVYSDIEQIKKLDKFNVITLWHVLEHVSELRPTFKKLKKLLTDDGHMIIAVPNPDSFDAHYYKQYWAAYDVPRHLYHFTQKTIKQLAQKHKMKIVDTIPMKLDAYYVSMLSEKNRYKKNNFFRALRIGYESNKNAKANNHNYSSLIYVLQK